MEAYNSTKALPVLPPPPLSSCGMLVYYRFIPLVFQTILGILTIGWHSFIHMSLLFEGKVALSKVLVATQLISVNKMYSTIHQTGIYPVESLIHPMNRGLVGEKHSEG